MKLSQGKLFEVVNYYTEYQKVLQNILNTENYGLPGSYENSPAFKEMIQGMIEAINELLNDWDLSEGAGDPLKSLIEFQESTREMLLMMIRATDFIQKKCSEKVKKQNKGALQFWITKVDLIDKLLKEMRKDPIGALLTYFDEYTTVVVNAIETEKNLFCKKCWVYC